MPKGIYDHKGQITHGLSHTPFYQVWQDMLRRCNNSKAKNFSDYGGRGIRVCNEWLTFENFHKDMRPMYKKGLSLDRIDNDGDYTLKNCRWATPFEQANNKRWNHFIEYKGIRDTTSNWARYWKLNPSVLITRLNQLGWDIQIAFETPVKKNGGRLKANPLAGMGG